MKIAFVGVKRKYLELPADYRDHFNQYHLELPFYYARDGKNDVTITTVDYKDDGRRLDGGFLRCTTEEKFKKDLTSKFDVVVHWRKWFPELHRPEAINVINCQDHSFSGEWVAAVHNAITEGKLRGILCFPHWHARNLKAETGLPDELIIPGLTLGVDTDIYKPAPDDEKGSYDMLWASDPGRGLAQALQLHIELYKLDQRFKLHVCYPDYVPPMSPIRFPGIVWHGNVSNGPKLWELFNKTGILAYTSTFREPSSRAHRQAQAAGSLVLYPPDMGTPSDLIRENGGGIVAPVKEWPRLIVKSFLSSGEDSCVTLGNVARQVALSENWAVQAKRFNDFFQREL